MKCDFCGDKGEWKNVIRSAEFCKKDGSDIVICNDCLNFFADEDFEKLSDRVKNRGGSE
jgi:ribosome-binding protein aMBF1 (putative translation factor)